MTLVNLNAVEPLNELVVVVPPRVTVPEYVLFPLILVEPIVAPPVSTSMLFAKFKFVLRIDINVAAPAVPTRIVLDALPNELLLLKFTAPC